jgi:putative copper export protein
MINLATWIVWVHILAAAVWIGGAISLLGLLSSGEIMATGRRLHFLTSRAMELLVLTGVLNILVRGVNFSASFSPPFFAMLSVKMALFLLMAGLQIWMGIGWRRSEPAGIPLGRFRIGLVLQLTLGAMAILVGLGVHAA